MMQNKISWLYIAGRGHSGSTMLDGMLGNVDDIESIGELISGMNRYEALCSCGEKFKDCQYWIGVRKRFKEKAGISWDKAAIELREQAHLKNIAKTAVASSKKVWIQRLRIYSECIAGAVCQKQEHKMILDSSKELSRALFLLRFLSETKIIHLIRHPVSILQSDYYRLKNGTGFKFLRRRFYPTKFYAPYLLISCIGWIFGNILSDIVRQFGKKRFLRVKYEDLITNPIREIDRIEHFAGISLDTVKHKIINGEKFYIGHNIGGNHMRMTGSFVFDPKKSKRTGLPKRYRILTNIVCLPLLFVYGYKFK